MGVKLKLTNEPVVVLFDEFPWIHTPRSGFLSAFGHWWNTWASRQALLKVVICGPAASWMIENIINNKGGSGWRYIGKKGEDGAQIDLLLDRKDHCINLCEIKFSSREFVIDKRYAGDIENKVQVFKNQSKTRKTIFSTMITLYGVSKNDYYTNLI